MSLRRSTSGCIWCIVLALLLGLVGVRVSAGVSRTEAQSNSFVFTAHGDLGAYNDPDTLASLSVLAGTNEAFSLSLGDMNYESVGDEQRWCQTVQNILGPSHPFEIVMGNHEDEDKISGYIGNFVQYCPDRMNAQGIYGAEYFFDYPAAEPLVRVIMIGAGNDWDWDGNGTLESDEYFDYDSTTPAHKAHLDWLINQIDSARSAGIRWIVVGMHKNCITIGQKSCEIGPDLLNVLVEKKVDLILQGHDHTYQRSKQLSLGSLCRVIAVDNYDSDCVVNDGADGIFEKGAGPILIVAGHFGGSGFYSVSPSDPESGYFAKAMGGNGWIDFLKNDTLHSPASRGFVRFVVSDSRIDVEHVATTDPNTGFSDVFSIVASDSPTPVPTPRATATRTPIAIPSPTQTIPATLTPIPSPSGNTTTVRLVPVADAYVNSLKPDANYGTSAKLRTDDDPDTRSFMKFDVQGIDGTVTRAILRLYANSASSTGYNVNRVSDSSWTELELTYNSAPPVGEIIGSSGPIVASTWTTIDVTPLVVGNGPLPLALTPIDDRSISFSSHEGENSPELIITFTGQTPESTPGATFTPTRIFLPTDTPTPTSAPQGREPNTNFQPSPPYYASFFYLWYQQPDTDGTWSYWNDYGNNPPKSWFSHYLPDYRVGVFDPASELYSSMNYDVFKWQVSKLAEAKQEVAIASWWGPGRKEDVALQMILNTYMFREDNPYPNLRWCIYYEPEGYADVSADTLVASLDYIKSTLASSPAYLRVGGKPVIFVYAGANDTPGTMSQRWKQANAQLGNSFYVVLKVYPGYSSDVNQPDSWHEYDPARRSGTYGSYSAFVSPGFWLDDGRSSARLPRSLSEFQTAVMSMVNADVTWKLVETWNEWGEGTSVEPGDQVIETSSGEEVLDPNGTEFGNAYIDILNANLPPLESKGVPTPAAFIQRGMTLLGLTRSGESGR